MLTNIAPTTELQAVNAMLSSIGEAPVQSLETSPRGDVEKALNILRDATREVQARGWRFNTEFNYKLTPVATFEHSDGGTLNVFTPPPNLAGFRLSLRDDQYGMDAVVRKSREYLVDGEPVEVLYDRIRGRDGWEEDTLYIDPTWFLESFSDLPETARRYIVVVASRRFAADQGALEKSRLGEQDEQVAFQDLMLEQRRGQPQAAPWSQQTSELDALNQVLANLGMEEVPSLYALSHEAVHALNVLRRVAREVQSEGWRYNTDLGLELEPVAEFEGRNIFVPPADNMISWELARIPEQRELLVSLRPPKEYDGHPRIFYDRRYNRDGLDLPRLLINAIYFFKFEDMPDVVRRFIVALASKQVAEALPNGADRARVTEDDISRAWRQLQREQGDTERYSFVDSRLSLEMLGGRQGSHSFVPNRNYTE